MANEDYGNYSQFILQEISPEAPLPPMPAGSVTNMCYLDDTVIPGSWNVITAWFWPRKEPLVVIPDAHHHEEREVVCFYGSNPDDPFDLCGEVEFWFEDQKNPPHQEQPLVRARGHEAQPTGPQPDRPADISLQLGDRGGLGAQALGVTWPNC